MAPTELTTFQGEARIGPYGLDLTYTTVKKPMRDALKEESHTSVGLTAALRCSVFMNERSSEWFTHLLRAYDDHVVEFSCYSKCWGTIEGYNTVFWEVRKY